MSSKLVRYGFCCVVGFTCLLVTRAAFSQVGLPNLQGQDLRKRQDDARKGAGDVDESAKTLHDPDAAKRLEAVKQISNSQDKKAIEYLIEATADEDPRVKIKAIDALGNLRAADATPVLIQALYLRSSEPWLKQRILVALGKIGDNRAVRPIGDYLSRDTDVATLGNAVFALGEIGDKAAVPDLQRVADTSSDERLKQIARDAIGKIEQKQINPEVQVKALQDALGDQPKRPASSSAAPPIGY